MRLKINLPVFNLWLVALVFVLVAKLGSNGYAQTEDAAGDDAILSIGSKAPALDIETWFSDREGEFEPTTSFEPGKIYLIDFWATWSPRTHPWMVKYAALQDRYIDDGLQIIRVSDEDEDSVADFLELDVKGNAETIYAEWALGYCVATDPDRSVHQDYTVAAQHTRLPVVFIVGRTGLIEWLGDPAKMQKPLKEIVDGTWKREAFGAKLLAQQRVDRMAAEVRELLQRGETEEALKLIEKMMIDAPDSKVRTEMAKLRLQLLLEMDGPNIAEAFKEVAAGYADDAYKLNEVTWPIVTRQMGGKEIPADLLDVATETAERAVKLARENAGDGGRGEQLLGMILDTHAHLVFLQGDLDKALELQTEACELNQRDDLFEYLDVLQKEAAKRKKDKSESVEESKEDASNGDASKDEGDQEAETEAAVDGLGKES